MIELIIVGVVALLIFAAVYYQGYRDSLRWKGIQSGKSLVEERDEIPPLELEGHKFNSHDRKVLVIWSDLTQSSCLTVGDGLNLIEREVGLNRPRSKGCRLFAWNGRTWQQRK